jgi:hypothetical protein
VRETRNARKEEGGRERREEREKRDRREREGDFNVYTGS